MRIADFELERFFARYEFAVRHLLCASDVEGCRWPSSWRWPTRRRRRCGRPAARLHGVARPPAAARARSRALYETVDADDVVVFSGAEEAIFAVANVHLQPGRPRDRRVARVPEPARGRPGVWRRRDAPRAAGARWLGDRRRSACARQVTPRTRLIVVNAPHNPTGCLPDAATYRAVAEHRRGRRRDASCPTRSTAFLELDPADAAARRRGRRRARRLDSASCRSRSRWPGCGSAGSPRTTARCSTRRPGSRTTRRSAPSAPSEILALIALRARDGSSPGRRRSSTANLALLDGFFERQADALRVGPAARRLDRLPELLTADADRPFAAEPARGRGRPPRAGLAVRPPGQPLPPRLRAGTDSAAGLERLEAYVERALPVPNLR